MNKIELENISEATGNSFFYNAASENDFDRIAVKMLLADLPPFLVPVKIMNKYDNCVVKYDVGAFRSIQSVKMRMSKTECCTLLYNILNPLMTCGEWLLDYHKFCFRKEYIFCNANTFDVKFIYILDREHYCTDSEIMDVIRSIFKNTDIIDDKDFRINLLQALLDEDFSINSLYDMIINIRKKPASVSAAAKKEPLPVKPKIEKNTEEPRKQEQVKAPIFEKAQSVQAEIIGDNSEDDDVMESLFSDGRKKTAKPPKKEKRKPDLFGGIFGKNKASKERSQANISEAVISDEKTEIAGISTDLSDDETQIVSAFLHLESAASSNCPEIINISVTEGSSMTIGRKSANAGAANADVEFPAECTKISRKHCQIRLENGVYAVCDLNSGNGTYVDGKKAAPGEWIEIHNGSRIMLGNEVAVYSMQINA